MEKIEECNSPKKDLFSRRKGLITSKKRKNRHISNRNIIYNV